jgi:hypothetical protein
MLRPTGLIAILLILPKICGAAQLVHPLEHPNHYILLVDASGSAVSPNAKRSIFNSILTDELLSRLYKSGFGDAVPTFSPERDLLTLLHFGVVTGPSRDAYLRLKQYDLLADFIHTSFFEAHNVSREDLATRILPQVAYQFTILSWAPQLGLAKLRSSGSKISANRTFLIFVHDGQPNDYTTRAEAEAVWRYSATGKRQQTKAEVDSIQHRYLFLNGQGAEGPAWSLPDSKRDSRYPFFIEVYEIVPKVDQEWGVAATGLQPLERLNFRWLRQSGEQPYGVLDGNLSRDFLSWRVGATALSSNIRVHGSHGASGVGDTKPRFSLPVSFGQSPRCALQDLAIKIEWTGQRGDSLLGTRTFHFTTASQNINAPRLSICTTRYWAEVAGTVAACVLVLILLISYLRDRFFTTCIEIWLPGQLHPLQLKRRGSQEARSLVPPKPTLEALRLVLPARWRQALFTSGATLSLASAEGPPQGCWISDGGTSTELHLPAAGRQVYAVWLNSPITPARLLVIFHQGRQKSYLAISYPTKSV